MKTRQDLVKRSRDQKNPHRKLITESTKRLDLDPQLLLRAKHNFAAQNNLDTDQDLQNIGFREVLDNALEQHLPTIIAALDQGGFKRHKNPHYRNRTMTSTTWKKLDELSKKYDTSKAHLIRALITLQALGSIVVRM